MNWTLWQNIVSPHLSPIARALASIPGQTVTVVAENSLPERRRASGWRTPDCSPARVLIGPTDSDVERLVTGEHGKGVEGHLSVHLLNGLPDVALNRRVLPLLARTGAIVGLISERADNRGILGLARRAKYHLDRYLAGRNLDFILAMGQSGVRWFESAGYDSSRIFPFAYVTEEPLGTREDSGVGNEGEPFRILYLGQIIRRKDGITAIRALDRLSTSNWRFDIVGGGPDLERWKSVAADTGVSHRIRFRPAVDNRAIGNLLEHADLLLLPSRNDGWGAVVNEALLCGVPVICSDNCGAADLLREPWRGSTFKAGSVESLRGVLHTWIERGRRTEESSTRIREWSSVLQGPSVARYLVEVVTYMRAGGSRPYPPWY
jgi:glycosyltransferase involved in cell wall biosynthesis